MVDEENSGPSGVLETMNMMFRAIRYMLAILNTIIIIITCYFMFTARNLGGEPLQMSTWVRILYCSLVIITGIIGLIAVFWYGKKTKIHLKIILTYLISITILVTIGIILAIIYVRKPSKYDIIFIIGTVFATILITLLTLSFGYALKKTKILRRFNLFSFN